MRDSNNPLLSATDIQNIIFSFDDIQESISQLNNLLVMAYHLEIDQGNASETADRYLNLIGLLSHEHSRLVEMVNTLRPVVISQVKGGDHE